MSRPSACSLLRYDIMKKIINMLKKDDNALSLGRVCALVSFIAFIAVSALLAVQGKSWGNYDTFAWICAALMFVQLGNKAIECGAFRIVVDKKEGERRG